MAALTSPDFLEKEKKKFSENIQSLENHIKQMDQITKGGEALLSLQKDLEGFYISSKQQLSFLQAEQETLLEKLKSKSEQTQQSIKEFETRAQRNITEHKERVEKMITSFQERTSDISSSLEDSIQKKYDGTKQEQDARLQSFRDEINRSQGKFEAQWEQKLQSLEKEHSRSKTFLFVAIALGALAAFLSFVDLGLVIFLLLRR